MTCDHDGIGCKDCEERGDGWSRKLIEESAESSVELEVGGGGRAGGFAKGGGGDAADKRFSVSSFATRASLSAVRSVIYDRTFVRSLEVRSVSSV